MNPKLTPREHQVLAKLVGKLTIKAAASDLGLSRVNVYNVAGRLADKGFDCSTEAGRAAGKAYLAAHPQLKIAPTQRIPGLTEYQAAILHRYAKGESYEAIALNVGREWGKHIRPGTITQAISQMAQVLGSPYRSDPLLRRQFIARKLKELQLEYVSPTLPADLDPANY